MYRNSIDNQTKHTLIAFKLLNTGDFWNGRCYYGCNCRDAMHCVSTYPQLRTYPYTYLHPGTIAAHVRGVLSLNRTDFNALRDNAVLVGLSCFFVWQSLSQLDKPGRNGGKTSLAF